MTNHPSELWGPPNWADIGRVNRVGRLIVNRFLTQTEIWGKKRLTYSTYCMNQTDKQTSQRYGHRRLAVCMSERDLST